MLVPPSQTATFPSSEARESVQAQVAQHLMGCDPMPKPRIQSTDTDSAARHETATDSSGSAPADRQGPPSFAGFRITSLYWQEFDGLSDTIDSTEFVHVRMIPSSSIRFVYSMLLLLLLLMRLSIATAANMHLILTEQAALTVVD